MADLTNSSWSETDSSNTQPAPSGFPSGILPSQVGGVVRAMMGAVKRAYNHGNSMVTSTGSANAYVLTYEQPLQAGYVKGEVFRFFANFTNTGPSTLNINGAGTRSILRADGSALVEGEIVVGQVITVVFDGANFLAQNVISKDFKTGISVARNSDAIVMIEDTGAPATSFRRKQIYSTRNDGNAGNDWLFRQIRPSDGVFEDFRLKNGTSGTIWTTGNFNPDLKANLSSATFTGTVSVRNTAAQGFVSLISGSTDRAGYVAFNDKDGVRHGYIGWSDGNLINLQAEKGDFNFAGGTPRINSNPIWHTGNFTPDSKASLGAQVRFNGLFPGATGEGYIYSDASTNNVRLRAGTSANGYKYLGLNEDGLCQNFTGGFLAETDVRAKGRVVVGEGQTNSYIEMRDTDEGTRYVHNNGGNIGFLGSAADWVFRVRDDGTVWTKQFGDLATRIDSVATAQGSRGRDEANANTANNYFNKTTGTAQQVSNIPSFNAASIDIVRGNVYRARLEVGTDAYLRLKNGDTNGQSHAFGPGGDIWTAQLGDLNTRIEDRAYAWAMNGRDQANNNTAANYANKTNGVRQDFKGDILINKAEPRLKLDASGVGGYSLLVHTDNRLYIQKETGFSYVNNAISIGAGGDIWSNQFGDLNTRIETRAANYADDRASYRVAKTGDTMTGTLTMNSADPTIVLWNQGGAIQKMVLSRDGHVVIRDGADADNFRFQHGGALWTRQLGDLNQRIEDRAYAWAATRQANLGFTPVEQGGGNYMGTNKVRIGWDGPASALRAQVDGAELERILTRNWINPIIDVRLAYAGDLDNNWNFNAGNYAEPYGGAVITTRATVGTASGDRVWGGGRWRYLQKQDSYGNWYTVGYA